MMKKYTLLILLTSVFIIFLNSVESVSAEIEKPYVVDEKTQVLFGDSIKIIQVSTSTSGVIATTTYQGLENYTQDYVDGYAHFTFTYTHNRCCFASYPPSLYITNVDPRTTSTPIEKIIFPVLDAPSLYWYGPTDWYLVSIQFDATGFTINIKQAGVSEIWNVYTNIVEQTTNDWVALTNQYPASSSLSYSMAFTPVPIKETFPSLQTPDPVIIIPGIMGSAYKNEKLVIDPILHTYDDLIATLIANGYTEGKDLFTFPYEWRDSNVFSANLLDDKINQVKLICGCSKVDIVAHSMGGLVSRAYIQSVDYDDDVDQVIFLGTPHKGVPKAYLQWEAGRFPNDVISILTGLFFEIESLRNGYSTIFNYIHNKPILSIQELLPIFDYLKDDTTNIIREYPNNYPKNNFLESLNTNILRLLDSNVNITNIIGNSNTDTLNIVRVVPSTHPGLWEHGEPDGFYTLSGDRGLENDLGDRVVTVEGANLHNSIINKETKAPHNRIPTVMEGEVFNILTGKTASTTFDHGFQINPIVLIMQLKSPVDFVITAPDNKRAGKNFLSGNEYDEIPLAFYSGFKTDDEYITILNPLDGEYKIEIQGTDNGGEYELLASYVSNDAVITQEISGLTEFDQITILNVRINNNPAKLESKKVVTLEVLLNDIIKSYKLGWITDKRVKNKLLKKARLVIKTEREKENDKGEIEDSEGEVNKNKKFKREEKRKKAERSDHKIGERAVRSLLKELEKYRRKDKINEQAYNIIAKDLGWLMNN